MGTIIDRATTGRRSEAKTNRPNWPNRPNRSNRAESQLDEVVPLSAHTYLLRTSVEQVLEQVPRYQAGAVLALSVCGQR